MPIFRETPCGVPRRWAPSDETLQLIDIELMHFYSDGCRVATDVYKPKGLREGDKRPGIVLVGGFTTIKEVYQANYAQAFAEKGFVSMCFDFRGFGESDGRRGRLFWEENAEDVRNAITFLQCYPGVDRERIGLWGTSYGAGIVIYVLSVDERAKAAIAQVGSGDEREHFQQLLSPEQLESLTHMIDEDRRRRVLHNDPMFADPVELLGHEGTKKAIEELKRDFPQMHGREIPVQFLEKHMEFTPSTVIERKGDRALLCIACTKDDICPVGNFKRLFDKAPEPKEWLEYDITHYEIYEGEIYEDVVAHMIRFCEEHL